MLIKELEMDEGGESVQDVKGSRMSSFDQEDDEQNVGDDMNDFDECDDEDEVEEEVPVKLGFAEKPEHSYLLLRQVFPSKAGGVPAWLDPIHLPSGRSCLCDMCGEPLQFLLQVYAPTEKDSTFHRTLYVFMCPSMTCLLRDQHEQWKRGREKPSRSVKVFRCQMPLTNPFYSSNNPKYDGTDKPLGLGVPLCAWCGTWKGDKVCTSCRRVRYCSEKHQVKHWRANHKHECQELIASSQSSDCSCIDDDTSLKEVPKVASKTLWPAYEIDIELESEIDPSTSEADEDSNPLISRQQKDDTIESLMDSFAGDDDRRSWAVFQERLAKAPDQVLRYSRDERATPLWPTSSGRPSREDIPRCVHCGGALTFEFQILPQLLYYFGVKNDVDSLDWATIAVYSCADSCEGNVAYKEEFAWVQLASQSANVA